MLHLAQHFESDGGMNHCNCLLPASNFEIFSQNFSRLMLFSSKPNFRCAHQFLFSISKIKEIKGFDPSLSRTSIINNHNAHILSSLFYVLCVVVATAAQHFLNRFNTSKFRHQGRTISARARER